MTYGETIDVIKANQKRIDDKVKLMATMAYKLGDLIKVAIGGLFDEDVKYPSLTTAFPKIFDDIEELNKPKQQDWRIAKDRLLSYANHFNKKRGENK
ncbi:hypothetical protein IAI10_02035 [Clostridium sp. 19966]|uniref:hypothetical protein n=1 Tax=Clostridium sp. 19966 TaxID=2768166 RepID=UPI0028DE9FC0|nr:hypothetical protein [Clostridium sp. 19966]MDT8715436.1 hypothetical protein [Clostridium sp. 19966]